MYEKPVIWELNMKTCTGQTKYFYSDACKNTEEKESLEHKLKYNQWPAQTCTKAVKLNRTHVRVTMCVSVSICTIITRQAYCLPYV